MPLFALGLAYLALPLFLFAAGWLRLAVALPLAVLAVAAALALRRELATRIPTARRLALGLAVVAAGWTSLSGVAGLGFRNSDWLKHEAVLKALATGEWPVVYDGTFAGLEGDRHALVFYLAHYLPAGAVGRLFGWGAANAALAVWTAAGVWIALRLFLRLAGADANGKSATLATALFVFASGLDVVGALYLRTAPIAVTDHLEGWSRLWQYSSDTTLLFWAPHQALGGWIATALLLEALSRREIAALAPLAVAAALLWSPFAALGLLPFAVLGLAREPRATLRPLPTAAAAATAAVLVLYFAALRQERLPASLQSSIFGPDAGFYLAFVALEFGLVWLAVRPRREPADPGHALWILAGVTLAALPFVRFGLFNDWAMRVSIPALFVVWLLAARALVDRARPAALRVALAALLALGAATPATEIARSLRAWQVAPRPLRAVRDLPVAHADSRLARQYFGPPGALFFRWLAKPLPAGEAPLRPEGEPR